ncbi:MAG: L-seryl-tRNA(Sec) selenium transferase [Chitinivibrionales bacterium]|nr:L-seryl-tRNA(Sec) selenium transferase [Chitinivibrionales bacterium]
MTQHDAFNRIPGVDTVLAWPQTQELVGQHGRDVVVYCIRRALDTVRAALKSEKKQPDKKEIIQLVESCLDSIVEPSLKPVVNATGVILHTNLGRAPLGETVLSDLTEIIRGYSNVEFDLAKGKRGQRAHHLKSLICYLIGAEDAVVVNNNAAAIILLLSTFARDKEVIISRGELIEIGGSFRIPEIMAAGGARMIEVGTTNKTRLRDYENALNDTTGLIFKAHTSNYAIRGFTEEVPAATLAKLASRKNIPFVYDIGSGLLRKPELDHFRNEPDIRAAINDGADLVTFSCDKLLGGPQAGIVAGTHKYVQQIAKAPLMRALRVGKLTFAALSSAARHYLSEQSLTCNNPAYAMFTTAATQLEARAKRLLQALSAQGVAAELIDSAGQPGGGSLPETKLRSKAVRLIPRIDSVKQREAFAERMYRALLALDKPVIGVMRQGYLHFDVLTIFDEDLAYVAQSIITCVANRENA